MITALDIARTYLGTRELLPNGKPNPMVAKFFQATGFKGGSAADAWCSAFVNYCVASAGGHGTHKANARSWLTWGQKVDKPEAGDIVVFSRPPSVSDGHVAFYLSEDPSWIIVLGGNQRNCVCEAPYARSRLLSYRRAIVSP